MELRPVEAKDQEAIRKSVYDTAARVGQGKQWFRTIDPEKVIRTIYSREYLSYVVNETYVVLADCGSSWFADERDTTLAEMLVLKVYPDGPGKFSDIPRALAALARAVGARAICVGTALAVNNRALARMYAREGFEASAVEMYKTL